MLKRTLCFADGSTQESTWYTMGALEQYQRVCFDNYPTLCSATTERTNNE